MMNTAFRVLLTFNATSLLVIIFAIQKGYSLGYFFGDLACFDWIVPLPNIVSYALYFLIPILSTSLSIWLSKYLGKDEFEAGTTKNIEHANNSFLPSYLGYFFVGLSIDNWETFWFIYGILFVFTLLSQALYFNPLFLIFGYNFYNIKTKTGTAIFLISKKRYKKPDDIHILLAYRINNYTFIERK